MSFSFILICLNKVCAKDPHSGYCPDFLGGLPALHCPDSYAKNATTMTRSTRSENTITPPQHNTWYDNLNASAGDAGQSNCIVCFQAFPRLYVVQRAVPEGNLTDGTGTMPFLPYWSYTDLGSSMQLTSISPLDCMLMRYHTPLNKSASAAYDAFRRRKNETIHHCIPPPKPPKTFILPMQAVTPVPNLTFTCLWRLRIPEGKSLKYPKSTKHFSNDTHRCTTVWPVIGLGDEYRAWRSCNVKANPACALIGPLESSTAYCVFQTTHEKIHFGDGGGKHCLFHS